VFKYKLPTEKSRVTSDLSSISHEEIVENAKRLVNAEDMKRICMSEGWGEVKEARIRLIVTAISFHNPPETIRNALFKASEIRKLGIIYAIQIGPIILEWNDSSILIPCEALEWDSGEFILALDMKTITPKDFFTKYADPVSEVIANWNGTYMYNEYTNNCQLFSEKILKAMEIENVFSAQIQKLLNSISTVDIRELVFTHKFDDDPREYEIKNHSELDELCHNKNPTTGSKDYELLKAYDRVFWLRYIGVAVGENFTNDRDLPKELLMKKQKFKSASNCFFGDLIESPCNYYPNKNKKIRFDGDWSWLPSNSW